MPCPYRHRATFALLAFAVACVSRTVTPRGAVAAATPDQVEGLVRLAVTLDAAGDHAADTLYAPDAIVVGNARVRLAAPRFAGISYGGRVTIAAATVTVEGRFAWVMMDYRWINAQQGLAEAGRVTFVCEQRERGWRIVHAHSSQVLPWDR
jgi:hypothetical protein